MRWPNLIRLASPEPELAADLWLLTHRDLRQSARVRALLDFLAAEIARKKTSSKAQSRSASAHFILAEGIEMEPFVYQPASDARAVRAWRGERIKDEAERLGVKQALVLSRHRARGERAASWSRYLLGERSAGIHAGAVMHTPPS